MEDSGFGNSILCLLFEASHIPFHISGVWVVTILPASFTCVSYLFHILVRYR